MALTVEAVAKEMIPKHPGVEMERVWVLGAEENEGVEARRSPADESDASSGLGGSWLGGTPA